jgi:hypothetical protein
MTTKIPNGLLIVGVFIYAFLSFKNHILPQNFSHWSSLNTFGDIIDSSLLSASLFLSLYGLFTQAHNRKQFFWLCFASSMLVFLLFLTDFMEYEMIAREVQQFDNIPSMLPELTEKTRTASREEDAKKLAKFAYKLYGVKLAYYQDDRDLIYYEPTEQDITSWREYEQMNSSISASLKTIKKHSWGILSGDFYIIGTFFLTFIMGSFWIAFKKPISEATIQS